LNTVIYDLDGTLVDSATIVLSILNDMRVDSRMSLLTKNDVLPWLSLGGEDLVGNALGLSKELVKGALKEFRERYSSIRTPISSVYPEVFSTLTNLKSSGINLALCTNKPRRLVANVLCDTGLDSYFDFISAGGDFLVKKPDPLTLRVCLDCFGVKNSEAVMVGDSTVDCLLARNVDVSFVLFSHGYNDGVDLNESELSIDKHSDLFIYLNKVDL
jgi:phosphoglycolate phosphatase